MWQKSLLGRAGTRGRPDLVDDATSSMSCSGGGLFHHIPHSRYRPSKVVTLAIPPVSQRPIRSPGWLTSGRPSVTEVRADGLARLRRDMCTRCDAPEWTGPRLGWHEELLVTR